MADVKLLGSRSSPFVNRVQIALNSKSVNHVFLEEKFGSKSDILLRSNPVHKKIPVLIHGDKPICESLIIVEYIDQVWSSSPSILPSDPFDCAIARFWAAYVDDKLPSSMKQLRTAQRDDERLAAIEEMVGAMVLMEDAFVKCSTGKGFFGGDGIGYLDMALGSYLGWLRMVEKTVNVKLLDETKTPSLVGWAERFCSHDAVKDVIPGIDELMEVVAMHKAMAQAQSPN
ncbi:unnamed protein product [Camellia sinensis]